MTVERQTMENTESIATGTLTDETGSYLSFSHHITDRHSDEQKQDPITRIRKDHHHAKTIIYRYRPVTTHYSAIDIVLIHLIETTTTNHTMNRLLSLLVVFVATLAVADGLRALTPKFERVVQFPRYVRHVERKINRCRCCRQFSI